MLNGIMVVGACELSHAPSASAHTPHRQQHRLLQLTITATRMSHCGACKSLPRHASPCAHVAPCRHAPLKRLGPSAHSRAQLLSTALHSVTASCRPLSRLCAHEASATLQNRSARRSAQQPTDVHSYADLEPIFQRLQSSLIAAPRRPVRIARHARAPSHPLLATPIPRVMAAAPLPTLPALSQREGSPGVGGAEGGCALQHSSALSVDAVPRPQCSHMALHNLSVRRVPVQPTVAANPGAPGQGPQPLALVAAAAAE